LVRNASCLGVPAGMKQEMGQIGARCVCGRPVLGRWRGGGFQVEFVDFESKWPQVGVD